MVPTATFASRAIISIVAFSTPRRAKTRAAAVMIRAARASFSARRRSRTLSDVLTRAVFRELRFMNMNSRYTANSPYLSNASRTSVAVLEVQAERGILDLPATCAREQRLHLLGEALHLIF